MKAIYNNEICYVVEDDGDGVMLEPMYGTSDQQMYVAYATPGLIIDPTDQQIEGITKKKNMKLESIWVKASHISKIVMDYSGSGDDGSINDVVVYDLNDSEIIAEGAIEGVTENDLRDIGYDLLSRHYGGWENDDGGFGTITLNMADRTYHIDHNVYETISHGEEAEGKF